MKSSDIFIRQLEAFGVERIYGVPGEENLDLLESIRSSTINLILTRNEQTAVFMAANEARFTGKPGVALATLGPGATNMVTGVAYAQLSGLPLIVITGQKPIRKSKQGRFQIIDVIRMMEPITKYATSVVSGYKIPSILQNAWKIAISERPGVVAIELPEDIAAEEIELSAGAIHRPDTIRRPVPDEKMIQLLQNALEQAKSPIILIGAGANRKRISKYLQEFIVRYNMPFFASQMGKGVVDEFLSEFLGTAALTRGDGIHEAIALSDCIIAVGYDPIEKPTALFGFGTQKVIHVNFYEAEIDEVYHPTLEVIGDIGNVFWQLSTREIVQNWDFSEIYKKKDEYRKSIAQTLSTEIADAKILGPRMLVDGLQNVLEGKGILALDNGLYKVWIARNYFCREPNSLLLDNALATMGAGLASAMASKILHPEKSVICVTGDGGLVMNLGDIETAVRLRLQIVVVVLNNGSYGMIEWKQEGAGMENWGLRFGNPDFVQLAQSFGATGIRLESPHDFERVIRQSLHVPGLTIIDVPFMYPKDIN